jgi:rod shape-determining protein MreC
LNGRRNGILLALLLVAQLALMSGSSRGRREAARVERAVVWLSSPVVSAAGAIGGGVGGAVESFRELVAAHRRAAAYEAEVRRLGEELRRHREADAENQRLRRLLAMRELEAPRAVAASVVTAKQDGPTRMIVIDRGRSKGVVADLPVVAWGGAVGRVLLAGSSHAKVRLLTDANSGVGGLVQRSRARGIVFGRADEKLELRYVPRFSDVTGGDRVVTSGVDGIFPRGYGVGVVTAIRQEPDGTQWIELEPELDFGRLEEVLVLLDPPPLLDHEEEEEEEEPDVEGRS